MTAKLARVARGEEPRSQIWVQILACGWGTAVVMLGKVGSLSEVQSPPP